MTSDRNIATIDNIVDYFTTCENAYKDYWDLDYSGQMALGFWEPHTRSLREAIRNQNLHMANSIKVTQGQSVLDAGCGVGGSAIFLASECGAQVTGISIVPQQIRSATLRAEKQSLDHLLSFQVMNYMETNFANESFDVVWGVESICYAEPKSRFLAEAFRLLKPGGRLMIADPMAIGEDLDGDDYADLYTNGYNLCMVESLHTAQAYISDAELAGFVNTSVEDVTQKVEPSINRLYKGFYLADAYNKVMGLFGRRFTSTQLGNTRMLYYFKKALDKGLWNYGLMTAEKPQT